MKDTGCNLCVANFFYVNSPSWQYAKRWSYSEHNIVFVTEGTLYMELEDRRYAVRENEFLFMPRGSKSRGYRASDTPTGFYHAIFSSETVPDLANYFKITNTANIRTLYALLTDVSKNKDYDQDAKNSLLTSLLYEISYRCSREETADQTNVGSIAEAMKIYIDTALHRGVSLNDVAHHFGFSAKHTNRLFFADEHITVKAYINQLKIKRIEEHLMATNASIRVIAEKYGFSSAAALNKYYKYHRGKSIREFRAKFIE